MRITFERADWVDAIVRDNGQHCGIIWVVYGRPGEAIYCLLAVGDNHHLYGVLSREALEVKINSRLTDFMRNDAFCEEHDGADGGWTFANMWRITRILIPPRWTRNPYTAAEFCRELCEDVAKYER